MEPITGFFGNYRWLSNFWPARVTLEGQTFPSVENAYQAAKTTNMLVRAEFQTMTAGQAKRSGGYLSLRDDWTLVRLEVMEDLLRQKFQDRDLAKRLVETGDAVLIEGNTWGDTFWGVCRGRGSNHLGLLLMSIRAELSAHRAPAG